MALPSWTVGYHKASRLCVGMDLLSRLWFFGRGGHFGLDVFGRGGGFEDVALHWVASFGAGGVEDLQVSQHNITGFGRRR